MDPIGNHSSGNDSRVVPSGFPSVLSPIPLPSLVLLWFAGGSPPIDGVNFVASLIPSLYSQPSSRLVS